MTPILHGVLPVLHTPFLDDLSIDFETLGSEINYAYNCGADGIVFALASELLRLTGDERKAVTSFLCEQNQERGSVTISVGAESTRAAVEMAAFAQAAGASAMMAIPPLASAASEGELKGYFSAILNATSIPLVVQDASGYVGKAMSVPFQAQLYLDFGERVLFKPEASPVGPMISAIHELTNGAAQILEGSGGSMLVENFRRGVAGTMPGTDLLDAIVALWRALQQGDEERIYAIAPLVGSIIALAVNLDAFVVIEKHLMQKRGIFKNSLVRGPVSFALDGPTRAEIDRLYDRLQGVLAQGD